MVLVGTQICGEYLWVHRYLTCGSGYLVPDTCTDPGMGFLFHLTHRYRSRSPTDRLVLSLTWGKATCKFASKAWDIEKEKKGRIKMIIREAQAYVQRPHISCHRDSAGDTQEYDERDFLVDESCSCQYPCPGHPGHGSSA